METALAEHSRRLQATDAGTYDDNSPSSAVLQVAGIFAFAARPGIDRALDGVFIGDRIADERFKAEGAGDATVDLLLPALICLFHPLRVRHDSPAEADEVNQAVLQHLLGKPRLLDHVDRDHGDLHGILHRADQGRAAALLISSRL